MTVAATPAWQEARRCGGRRREISSVRRPRPSGGGRLSRFRAGRSEDRQSGPDATIDEACCRKRQTTVSTYRQPIWWLRKSKGTLVLLLDSDRRFQAWEYFVSHGSLLIRSPKAFEIRTNIDIVCEGVEYFCLPRYLQGVKVYDLVIEKPADIGVNVELHGSFFRVCRLISKGSEYDIIASSISISENGDDIFSSRFGWERKWCK